MSDSDSDELPSSPPRDESSDESSEDESSDDDSSSPRRDDPQPSEAPTISIGDAVYDEETRHAGVVEDIFPDGSAEINWKGRESSSRATASSATTNRRAFSRAAKKGPGSYKSRRSFSSTHAKDLALRFRAAAIRREPRAPVATTTFAAAPAAPAEGVGAGVRKLFQKSGYHDGRVTRVLESGAEIKWDDGESTTLDQHDYERALERYKRDHNMRAPRPSAAGASAGTRAPRDDDSSDDAQSDDDDSQSDAEAASSDDDDASSKSSKSSHEWSSDDDDDDAENEQPPRLPPPARMRRAAPSEASEPTPPSATVDEESSDDDAPPPPARPAAPSTAPRASSAGPRPPAPRAPVRRAATSGGDSNDDDSDSEESDDEDDPNREAIVLSQPVELTQDESSQEPESQGEVPPEPYSQQGPSGVRVEGFNPAALRDRIMTAAARAEPAPRLRLPPPRVEELDSTQDRWYELLRAAEWNNDAARRGLDKVKYAGDRSRLDRAKHLPPLDVLRDQCFKVLVVSKAAAERYQKHLKDTQKYYDDDTLIHSYGFKVERGSCVGLVEGDDGAPPEIVAVVANCTSVLHEAFVARDREGVRQARYAVEGGMKYLKLANRGNVSNVGDMGMVGMRKPRFPMGKQKRKRDGGVGPYKHDPRAKEDYAYLGGVCNTVARLSILEEFYAPERHVARVLLSEALNIPPLCQDIPRSLAPLATMAMSRGYACKLHTDKSGKTINETIVWPPMEDPPADWRFAIACFGRLVDLTGPSGVFVTLSGYRTVHGTLVSRRPDHGGMGFAAVLKENLINVAVRDALALGPKKARVG